MDGNFTPFSVSLWALQRVAVVLASDVEAPQVGRIVLETLPIQAHGLSASHAGEGLYCIQNPYVFRQPGVGNERHDLSFGKRASLCAAYPRKTPPWKVGRRI